ncbi:hypothetical protein KIN20_014625 [Parelaphostrongylus tenuis]|uniref:Secreted protein n=1 Tax=Parelaphostrongylus tenuis TaxID=148309 RepID=A0AAD5N3G5_PARTN|nr:hypothetical protein KIN20_014625 [Parelaphostrongylus tenuis]
MNVARLSTHLVTVSLLGFFSTALGGGVMPAGQGSSRPFTLTGFTLPVAMVYSPKADVPSVFLVLQLTRRQPEDLYSVS